MNIVLEHYHETNTVKSENQKNCRYWKSKTKSWKYSADPGTSLGIEELTFQVEERFNVLFSKENLNLKIYRLSDRILDSACP